MPVPISFLLTKAKERYPRYKDQKLLIKNYVINYASIVKQLFYDAYDSDKFEDMNAWKLIPKKGHCIGGGQKWIALENWVYDFHDEYLLPINTSGKLINKYRPDIKYELFNMIDEWVGFEEKEDSYGCDPNEGKFHELYSLASDYNDHLNNFLSNKITIENFLSCLHSLISDVEHARRDYKDEYWSKHFEDCVTAMGGYKRLIKTMEYTLEHISEVEETEPSVDMFDEFKTYLYDPTDINLWKLRSLEEMKTERLVKCHDAAHYFETKLKNIDKITNVTLYYLEYNDSNHSIVTYKYNDRYYIAEGTWWALTGIHGPFTTLEEMFRYIIRIYGLTYENGAKHSLTNKSAFKEKAHGSLKRHSTPSGVNTIIYEHNDVPEGTAYANYIKIAKGKQVYPINKEGIFEINNANSSINVVFIGHHNYYNELMKCCNEGGINTFVYQHGEDIDIIDELYYKDVCIVIAYGDECKYAKKIAEKIDNVQVIAFDDTDLSKHRYKGVVYDIRSVSNNTRECDMTCDFRGYKLAYGDGFMNLQYPLPAKLIFNEFISIE